MSGGLLALDLVNTVICRGDPLRRADRFEGLANLSAFAEAASLYRCDELAIKALRVPEREEMQRLVVLREAIDGWLRPQAQGGREAGAALGHLFRSAADCVDQDGETKTIKLGRAAAVSAMKLLDESLRSRVKICPGCDWLFVDRSKNRSRIWCDMAVCGNRAKASGHYSRRKLLQAGAGAEK